MFGLIIADYWWVVIPGFLLGLYAQFKVSSTYNRYARIASDSGMTGAQAARAILDNAGLHDVPILATHGRLTDHYDPMQRRLVLSEENYSGRSIAGVAVAAHEAGHALQHQAAYAPLQLRMAIVPITNFASMAYMGILFVGFLTGAFQIALPIVIGLFTVIAFFQLITLPVEFDASARAKKCLERMGLISDRERGHVASVLNAAALTYVAALVTSVLQLLQFVMLARGRE